MIPTIPVHNESILWALLRAGHDLNEFFVHYPKVQAWIEGEKKPTLPQLRDFAKKVQVPFGYLLLEHPPDEKLPVPYFRTLEGKTDRAGLNVYDTVLTLQKRQDWIREYLRETGNEPLGFVGRFADDRNVKLVVQDIRETLGVQQHWASGYRNWEEALDHLMGKIEAAGIFTVVNSVVDNNTHRNIPVDECRGFVLVDHFAPFMFVNGADSKAARMFTLVHELAHIWIGENAGFDFRQLQPSRDPVEQFCDQVASEFLVPEEAIDKLWKEHTGFDELARQFKVSQLVIARRALDLNKITKTEFFDFYEQYQRKLRERKERQGDGGNFYATLRNRLNSRFFYTVHQAVKENRLLHREAFQLTGLKGKTYDKAVRELQA